MNCDAFSTWRSSSSARALPDLALVAIRRSSSADSDRVGSLIDLATNLGHLPDFLGVLGALLRQANQPLLLPMASSVGPTPKERVGQGIERHVPGETASQLQRPRQVGGVVLYDLAEPVGRVLDLVHERLGIALAQPSLAALVNGGDDGPHGEPDGTEGVAQRGWANYRRHPWRRSWLWQWPFGSDAAAIFFNWLCRSVVERGS